MTEIIVTQPTTRVAARPGGGGAPGAPGPPGPGVPAGGSDGDINVKDGTDPYDTHWLSPLSAIARVIPSIIEGRFAIYNIADYGAEVDGVELLDVSMTSGSAVLDSAGYTFTGADVGKVIGVAGAGTVSTDYSTNANDGVLVSSIVSVASGNAVLANVAVNTVAAATAVFGTADDDAVSDAQDAAVAAGGGTVFFPAGRTVVTRPCPVYDYISWAGVHRDVSWVEVIFSAPGTGAAAANTCDWLNCAAQSEANPLTGASFHDFGVNARFHIRPGGYTNPMKPLNIFYVKRCTIERMNVWNTPTTAIPFDHTYEAAVIAYNVIKNPGRFFTQNTNPSKSGCSGIGIGTLNDGGAEPGLIIGNTIIGVGNATTSPNGNNGIFLEGQSGSVPATASQGYRIIDNYVEGMTNGIADEGSQGTIIALNIVKKCITGIRVTDGGVGGAFPGIDTLVAKNTIIDCVDPGAVDPTTRGRGIFVNSNASDNVGIRARIVENNIIGAAGRGISVNAGTNPISELVIARNKIRNTQRSGLYISETAGTPAALIDPVIRDNDIAQHGLAAVSNDMYAIYVNATLTDPTIKGNVVMDGAGFRVGSFGVLAGTGVVSGNTFPTVVIDGTIATTVRVFGNLGWATLDADAIRWIGPTDFQDIAGTTTLGNVNGTPYRSWPDAATTTAGVVVPIPTDWATFSVQLVWTSALASTGDVRLTGDIATFKDVTDVLATPPTGTVVTATTMADGSVQIKNLKTGIAGGKAFCVVNVTRTGAHANDTSTNPALVLGVRLIRTA